MVDYFSTPMAYLTKSLLSGITCSVRAMRLSFSNKFTYFPDVRRNQNVMLFFLCFFFFYWCQTFPYSPDGWSTEGCHAIKSTSNADETECSCNHLTHFAVLFDYSDANSKVSLKSLVGSLRRLHYKKSSSLMLHGFDTIVTVDTFTLDIYVCVVCWFPCIVLSVDRHSESQRPH